MTKQHSIVPDHFSAFSSAATEERGREAAKNRHDATSKDRSVMALETIADELSLIRAHLSAIELARRPRQPRSPTSRPTADEEIECWDNEDGYPA